MLFLIHSTNFNSLFWINSHRKNNADDPSWILCASTYVKLYVKDLYVGALPLWGQFLIHFPTIKPLEFLKKILLVNLYVSVRLETE